MIYQEIIPNSEPKDTIFIGELDFTQPILVIDKQKEVIGFITKEKDSKFFCFETFFKGSFHLSSSNENLNLIFKYLNEIGYKCITNVKF